VWEAIGPIPERLYRSEDTWFNLEAKKAGFRFRTARDAIVYWRPRRNLREVFRNAYLWTKSDIENNVKADLVKHVARVKLLRIIWRVLGILALLVCCIYISWLAAIILAPFVFKEMISFYMKDRSMKKAVYKNLINLAIALAYVRGYLAASWSLRASKKRGGGNRT
jgi:GT2 family glycosyltransferase